MNPPQSIAKSIQSLTWADRLRNLATVLVIAIHVAGPISQGTSEYGTAFWWAGNWWDSLGRPSVNLFVMLSGFLLLGKDYPLGDFLKRRFTRVVIPALFWMAIYCLYNYLAHDDPATIRDALRYIVENKVHYHLWFIYLIIGLYLSYPILRPWVRQATEQQFRYFFAICILGTWLYKIFYQFYGIGLGLYIEIFSNQIGNFVLGYYLGNKLTREAAGPEPKMIRPWPWTSRQMVWIAAGLIVAGTVVTAWGTYWTSAPQGKFHPYFFDYLTPNVGITAIGWFILAQHSLKRVQMTEFEKDFATASFGIYFVHVLILDWWGRCGYWAYKFHPAKCIPIVICLTVLMSFVAIHLLRGLPGGKKVT